MLTRTRNILAGVAVFTVFATSAFAATGTADKVLNSSNSVESVSIQGNGNSGNFYTNFYAGTGSGQGKLYQFVRFWPDTRLLTHDVASGQVSKHDTFPAAWDEAYNVVASGSYTAGIRSSVVIN